MLLNLDLIRKEGLTKRLIEYRKNGINYFMDQDAYNNVFGENVRYIDYTYNFTYSNYEYYSFEQLKKYYDFKDTDEECLLNNVKILHLSNKEKPWLFYDVPFSEEWDFYFKISPFKDEPLKRSSVRKKENKDKKTLHEELVSCKNELRSVKGSFSYKLGRMITHIPRKLLGFYYSMRRKIIRYNHGGLYDGEPRDKKIIVSMTSYPDRIKIVPYVLQSLLRQTVKPDKIILYLSREQFPEERLPRVLTKAERYGLDIIFKDDDLKPHKKYFYSMQEFPEDLIVTVDDDVVYHPKMIERLYKSYTLHPDCVSASRVHKMRFDLFGKILPYNSWHHNFKRIGIESMRLVATGVGGVLYPPHSVHPLTFNSENIKKISLTADDLWLKIMEVLQGTKVVLASKDATYDIIQESQEKALWITNVDGEGNDVQLNNILEYLGGERDFVVDSIRNDVSAEFLDCDFYNRPLHVPDYLFSTRDFNEYLKKLDMMKNNIIIAMVVMDELKLCWDDISFPCFLGSLKKPVYRGAYSNIIDYANGRHDEDVGPKKSTSVYKLHNLKIIANSYGYDSEEISYICCEYSGKKYAYCFDGKNNEGLHILTFSKTQCRVLDFVKVDLHPYNRLIVSRQSE